MRARRRDQRDMWSGTSNDPISVVKPVYIGKGTYQGPLQLQRRWRCISSAPLVHFWDVSSMLLVVVATPIKVVELEIKCLKHCS